MKEHQGLSTNALKILAVLFMFIDHIGLIFFEVPSPLGDTQIGSILDVPFRVVGRCAFPLFLFCLIEGYKHTSDKLNYMKRLSLFAVISEVPYDLGNYHKIWSWQGCNVMVTMFMIISTLYAFEFLSEKIKDSVNVRISCIITVCIICVIIHFISPDYGIGGYFAGLALYLIPMVKKLQQKYMPDRLKLIAIYGSIILLIIFCNVTEMFALADIPLIKSYNGQKGKSMKWFFYLFYPLHFVLLYGIYAVMF